MGPFELLTTHRLACERYRSQTVCVIRIVVIGFALEPFEGQYAQRGACLVPLNSTEVGGTHHRDVVSAEA